MTWKFRSRVWICTSCLLMHNWDSSNPGLETVKGLGLSHAWLLVRPHGPVAQPGPFHPWDSHQHQAGSHLSSDLRPRIPPWSSVTAGADSSPFTALTSWWIWPCHAGHLCLILVQKISQAVGQLSARRHNCWTLVTQSPTICSYQGLQAATCIESSIYDSEVFFSA